MLDVEKYAKIISILRKYLFAIIKAQQLAQIFLIAALKLLYITLPCFNCSIQLLDLSLREALFSLDLDKFSSTCPYNPFPTLNISHFITRDGESAYVKALCFPHWN